MTEKSSYRMIQLLVSEPVVREDNLYETTLSHPSLGGKLVLVHGTDRELMLQAICVDPKDVDPVSTLFRHISELKTDMGKPT